MVLVEGAVGNSEHLHMLLEIRKKAKVLVAFGDCAVTGNVPSLRNPLSARRSCAPSTARRIRRAWRRARSPSSFPTPFLSMRWCPWTTSSLGCPPSADRIWKFLRPVLLGQKPALSGPDLKFG